MKNLYSILGVPKTATSDEIKQAYRKLALDLHPDRTKGDKQKTERFREICFAYAILSNIQKRSEYDRESESGKTPFGPLFDELVEKVKTEGIGLRNLDSLLVDVGNFLADTKENLPRRVVGSAEGQGSSLAAMVERIFDSVVRAESHRKSS